MAAPGNTIELVRLSTAAAGDYGSVVSVGPCRSTRRSPVEQELQLLEMGLVEGARIEVVQEGPVLRDPIAVRVDGARIAIHRRDAAGVVFRREGARRPRARISWGARLNALGALLASFAAIPDSTSAAAVKTTAAQEQALGIRTATLAASQAVPIAAAPGVLVRPPSGRAAVSAPFAGTVTQLNVVEGEPVRAGQVLATVFSREALSEVALLRRARADLAVAAAEAARTRQLADEGVIAGARAADAEARAAGARAMLDARSVSVRAAGAGASGAFTLKAPFAGRVVDVQATTGQAVEAMSPAFVIDREERIQVEAAMPASLAGRVRPGARAAVEGAEGRVIAVGGEIDPKTRSLSVRAEIPPRPDFIPGRAVRLELFEAAGGLTAPRAAVTMMQGRPSVFVRTQDGFSPTAVAVAGYTGDRVILTGGVKPGQRVAVSGVSELKAMAER